MLNCFYYIDQAQWLDCCCRIVLGGLYLLHSLGIRQIIKSVSYIDGLAQLNDYIYRLRHE